MGSLLGVRYRPMRDFPTRSTTSIIRVSFQSAETLGKGRGSVNSEIRKSCVKGCKNEISCIPAETSHGSQAGQRQRPLDFSQCGENTDRPSARQESCPVRTRLQWRIRTRLRCRKSICRSSSMGSGLRDRNTGTHAIPSAIAPAQISNPKAMVSKDFVSSVFVVHRQVNGYFDAERAELCDLRGRFPNVSPLNLTRALQNAMFKRVSRQTSRRRDVEFAFDVFAVGFDSMDRDIQGVGNLAV